MSRRHTEGDLHSSTDPPGYPLVDAVLAAICAVFLVIALLLAPTGKNDGNSLSKGKETAGSVETASR